MKRLDPIRLRMALRFVASTGLVLVTLAAALFILLVNERSRELTRQLEEVTQQSIRAAAVIAAQQASAAEVARQAVVEVATQDVTLYLFDRQARQIGPEPAPRALSSVARAALSDDIVRDHFTSRNQTWRLVAQAFTVRNEPFVVVAVTDESVLDRHYVRLAQLFALAALLGVLLLGVSSYYFAGRAVEPIRASAEGTRRFMTDAAHELRTPVASLRAHADVALQRPGLDPETTDTLRTISTESARLTKLLSDLLTLARVDAGEPTVARESFFLDDVVSDATALMSAAARTKGIALGQGSYEEARVVGDPDLVRQLLAILLDNALKYTPAGGRVTTHVFMKDSRAVVAVEDNGPGIEEAALPHVFERFYRSDEARRTAVGAGLGLSIARWIVLAHGAELRVASWRGQGTRIEASFPAPV